MDDFNVSSLHESKNEWGARLLTILTPLVVEGFRSIFEEAVKLCRDNDEMDKYLMTFQNFITRIPKWNPNIIEQEKTRIIEKSACVYLEELVTCVHIIQLKLLTAMRTGQKQKKIDIDIPKLNDFIHKIYINVARKLYKNVYLFELGISPLQIQKHNREMELIIQECILNTVRETIPIEGILRAYLDESVEEEVIEDVKEQIIQEPVTIPNPALEETERLIDQQSGLTKELGSSYNQEPGQSLSFNNVDMVRDSNNNEEFVEAPKDIERLNEISELRNIQRKLETDEEDENPRLRILEEDAPLSSLDVHVIDPPRLELLPDLLIDDIEVLA
uniref:Uncharacterized protein n=1 Tax=viral metagenome TaxID=1070528 RepID=A0A6C0F3Z8_9ZZZZ